MKTHSIKFSKLVYCLVILSFLFTACEKNDSNSLDPVAPSGTTLKTTIAGKITDTNGSVVIGASVKLGSIMTTTDNRGNFLFVDTEVSKIRFVVTASKTGYFNCVLAKKTQNGGVNYVNLLMEELPVPVNIPGTSGGVVNIPGGAGITFPANSFIDLNGNAYSGQVKVYARHINPASDNFEAIVPGGDLAGVNAAGDDQSLYSLGMIEAILKDASGANEIKLAPGKTAELKFPIDPSQTSAALGTIPMWHLDAVTSLWQEEGQAIKSGSFYIGNVSHFTTWNCDYSGPRCDIQGKVVDCQNSPIPNIIVTINGFMNVTSDNAGEFTTWVPAGYNITCQVLQSNNPFIPTNSSMQSILAVAGQINIVPPLVVPCESRIVGSLMSCDGSTKEQGFIYASWNGYSRTLFSTDGDYKLYVPVNTHVSISASNFTLAGGTSVLSGNQGSLISAPDILFCNTSTVEETRFTINQNGTSVSYVLNILNTATNFTDQDADGTFESATIDLTGVTTPGNHNCTIQIGLYDETNGYYSLLQNSQNNVYIVIDSLGTFANGNFPSTTLNRLTVMDYGAPGSMMTGKFEFDYSVTGTITNGQFALFR